ncbi:protein of unknown function [Catalinimonas alkaloidigena]|uniref:SiaC family regulatory phosphoprotein domain-containing protein n=1 Tax=Catalinimonas alkaloidigena TaxID=1075417 RepID=A0A1G9BYA2_9BACT|nr:DUF1987 domain-containing protein [Catalinimonas alkaloidigena]SDK44432.1 protein of unknown function [Catalinimonas alkaloidigena]
MQELILQPTVKSPRVHFDPVTGKLEISGKSIPENSYNLYRPLIEWVEDYVAQPAARTELIFKLTYFNSSSAEYILELMKKLESLHLKGSPVEVRWFYDEEDEDMEQIGEDFKAILRLPIHMVVSEEDR